MRRSFLMHLVLKAWILFSVSKQRPCPTITVVVGTVQFLADGSIALTACHFIKRLYPALYRKMLFAPTVTDDSKQFDGSRDRDKNKIAVLSSFSPLPCITRASLDSHLARWDEQNPWVGVVFLLSLLLGVNQRNWYLHTQRKKSVLQCKCCLFIHSFMCTFPH